MPLCPFEQSLVWNCAPTLAGSKAASLFSWKRKEDALSLAQRYRDLNARLQNKGLALRPIFSCPLFSTILLYRPDRLEQILLDNKVQAFLQGLGYPEIFSLDTYLGHLAKRMKRESFPHEVGLFLNYPLADVEAFIEHQGRDFLYCGLWKAYQEPGRAKCLSEASRALCQTCLKQYLAHTSLEDLALDLDPGVEPWLAVS